MRERGLKHAIFELIGYFTMSLPMRERGLQTLLYLCSGATSSVAPHAGAWIETEQMNDVILNEKSRSPCGSVD